MEAELREFAEGRAVCLATLEEFAERYGVSLETMFLRLRGLPILES